MSSTSLFAPELRNNSFIYPKPISLKFQVTFRVCVLRNAKTRVHLVLQILIVSLDHSLSFLTLFVLDNFFESFDHFDLLWNFSTCLVFLYMPVTLL